jgi:hypothetical protein
MPRFILAGVMALATFALAAVPASAQSLQPADPHRPIASDWRAVNAVDWSSNAANSYLCDSPDANCSFSDSASISSRVFVYGALGVGTCTTTINGDVSSDGEISITSFGAGDCGSGTTNPAYLPATGDICFHKPTAEFWVRQNLAGHPLYAQVLVQPSGQPTTPASFYARGIMIGNPATEIFADHLYDLGPGTIRNYRHAAFDQMWATTGIDKLMIAQNSSDCGWPGLS